MKRLPFHPFETADVTVKAASVSYGLVLQLDRAFHCRDA